MILVDVNLLIYAIDSDAPQHRRARRWLEGLLSSGTALGLAWIVILAFLRLTTRPGILKRPMLPEQAMAFIDEWLALPHVRPVSPGDNHWALLRNLVRASGTAGNLTSDAHLAALALEHGLTVASSDGDFKRFAGLDYVNPLLEGQG